MKIQIYGKLPIFVIFQDSKIFWSNENEIIDLYEFREYLYTNGTSAVECDHGFKVSSENVCEDINECDDTPCNDPATCINTEGSFECQCADGWALDEAGTGCNDIDECDASIDPPTCDHTCNNTEGKLFGFGMQQNFKTVMSVGKTVFGLNGPDVHFRFV